MTFHLLTVKDDYDFVNYFVNYNNWYALLANTLLYEFYFLLYID